MGSSISRHDDPDDVLDNQWDAMRVVFPRLCQVAECGDEESVTLLCKLFQLEYRDRIRAHMKTVSPEARGAWILGYAEGRIGDKAVFYKKAEDVERVLVAAVTANGQLRDRPLHNLEPGHPASFSRLE